VAPTHAVIPAAGRGTRLLPLTRAVPKELLPLGRKPVVQHVAEELAAAGIEHVALVLGPGKGAIADHLAGLEGLGLELTVALQDEPRGLGDAVLCAHALTGGGPFVVALGDAVVGAGATRALVDAVERRGLDGAIAFERVAPQATSRYGVAAVGDDGLLTGLVEKPAPGRAPSELAVAARYLLPAATFDALRGIGPGVGGEVQLTDAIAALIAAGARIAAVELPPGTRRLDVGSHGGYAAAFVACALADPELAPAVRGELDALRER
jgi:UTP--glucose-1-phosphate uridylyltransferase